MNTKKGTGICECGCGMETAKFAQAIKKYGVEKGDSRRFVAGHYRQYKSDDDRPRAICHPDRIAKGKGLCGSCYNASLINRTDEIRAKCLKAHREKAKVRRDNGDKVEWSEKQRNRMLRHRYGIDHAQYMAMLAAQNNGCAICGKTGGDTRATRLYVDHNHETGGVRKLLCAGCNSAVGMVEKGPSFLASIFAYLAETSQNPPPRNAPQ